MDGLIREYVLTAEQVRDMGGRSAAELFRAFLHAVRDAGK